MNNAIVSPNVCFIVCRVMARRNDREIGDALESVAQALHGQQNHHGDNDEFRGLDKFHRNKSPNFKGGYDPEDAQALRD